MAAPSFALSVERVDSMYQFTDDCLLGIEMVDEEHRHLFRVINEIADILADETKTAEEMLQSAKKLTDSLKEYADIHFAHEEDYMKKIHDPELPRQKKEHAVFTEKVNGIDIAKMAPIQAVKVMAELMEYLSRWLYRHILASDTLIGKMKAVHDNPALLSFSDQYYTGIDMIDRQHRRLFEILLDLNELNRDEFLYDKYDAIVDVIEELKDYVVKHFQDEEHYMTQIQYEGLALQKTLHQSFIDKMEEINLEDIDENQQQYLDELIDFLANWLIHHIMKIDQKIPAPNVGS